MTLSQQNGLIKPKKINKINNMKYNRVMLGRGGMYSKDCRENGYIGANFDIAQDLTNELPDNFREFTEKFRPIVMKVTGKTKTSAGLSCGFLYTICKSLQKGDVVLCPNGAGSYYVGTIDGDYFYVPNTDLPHRRPVKWMDLEIPRSRMSTKLQSVTNSLGTCCEITSYANEIQNLMANATKPPMHTTPVQTATTKAFMERDLHQLFCTALRNNNIYAKTIYHEQSKKKIDTAQEWVHPVIVGVEMERFQEDATLSILKATEPSESVRLYSFELKKSIDTDYDLKKYFFQALSNSSWANYGYLVTFDLSDKVEQEEIRRLSNAFGIGIIIMHAKDYQVFCPARERSLDYDAIEKLNRINDNFSSFITGVSNVINATKTYIGGAKLSLEKICDTVFNTDEEIEDYSKKNGIPF